MVYKGRGAAKGMVVAAIVLVVVMVQIEMCNAAIGGRGRWTFKMARWPRSKHFRAGNVIAFNYDSEFHNVMSENKAGYIRCIIPRGSRMFQSSKDSNKLRRVAHYFICSIPGHCQVG